MFLRRMFFNGSPLFIRFVCLDQPVRSVVAQTEIAIKNDLALGNFVVEDFNVLDAV